MIAEERKKETEVEAVYKTKVVQFFGRSVPIILQNDNGPCPLIAISNVLLLRNNLNLSVDISEVSLQNLLYLVAGRIIDANSNVQGKDAEFVENQQQNIDDAINLLHRLATGIDVNLHFTRIDDFEFTPERSIFDLLGIELYHGWIVDPQDTDTLNAIGSKSYNALLGELVALESGNAEGEDKAIPEDDSIDFRAATTAALGVPSPCLSRVKSFDEPPVSVAADRNVRKGDMEEQEELDRALELLKASAASALPSDLPDSNLNGLSTISEEITYFKTSDARVPAENFEHPSCDEFQRSHQPEFNLSQDFSACSTSNSDGLPSAILSADTAVLVYKTAPGDCHEQSNSNESVSSFISTDKVEDIQTGVLASNETEPFLFPDRDASVASYPSKGDQKILHSCPEEIPMSMDHLQLNDNQSSFESTGFPGQAVPSPDSDSSDGGALLLDISEGVASSLEGSEPIYEGEERILDSGHLIYESREPMYEGEVILAEQADRGVQGDGCSPNSMDEVSLQKRKGLLSINAEQGELIRNFLKNNASQLTVYGLFCLQEGLKERELCVFFRNNHFSTMFKFNGELYLLATDQGYINQPDLVWEKLNEVNGDSVFMTGNFKEFKAENQASDLWDERSAMTNTADYLASIDSSAPDGSTLNSDLQLAIALQQQEFENQPQRQNPNNVQQSHVAGHSRLVTGPQGPRISNAPSRQETKTKEKCAVM